MENDEMRGQARQIIAYGRVLAEAIRDSGTAGIPSGHLYAAVMGSMTLGTYQQLIMILKNAGLVAESGHRLTWIASEEIRPSGSPNDTRPSIDDERGMPGIESLGVPCDNGELTLPYVHDVPSAEPK